MSLIRAIPVVASIFEFTTDFAIVRLYGTSVTVLVTELEQLPERHTQLVIVAVFVFIHELV